MSKPGRTSLWDTDKIFLDGGYVTTWYDSRRDVTMSYQWELYGGVPYSASGIESTGLTRGHFGFVTSYRGKVPRPRNMVCNDFTGERRTYEPMLGRWTYNYANLYVYQYHGFGAGYNWFRQYVGLNDLPYYDPSEIVSIVSSLLYQRASEPYVPPVHWLGELRETVLSLKRPLSSGRKLFKRYKRTYTRIFKSYRGNLAKMQKANDMIWLIRNELRDSRKTLSKSRIRHLKKKKRNLKWKIEEARYGNEQLVSAKAAAYLEYQFGLAPLVDMVNTIGEKIVDLTQEKRVHLRVHKAAHSITVLDKTEEFNYDGILIRRHVKHTVSARGQMTVQYVKPPTSIGNFSAAGLFQETITELYQLVGMSFFFDWFVHVGALLKESRPIPGEVVHSSVTVKSKKVETVVIYGSENPYITIDAPCGIVQTAERTQRHTDVTRPGVLRFSFGIDSIGKLMSTMALGISRFAK